jgi:hypothetical protein
VKKFDLQSFHPAFFFFARFFSLSAVLLERNLHYFFLLYTRFFWSLVCTELLFQ